MDGGGKQSTALRIFDVRRRSGRDVCDWELVGCDAERRVKVLALDFNGLNGTLPSTIGQLTGLTRGL
mgnify:CR=1 FL=1